MREIGRSSAACTAAACLFAGSFVSWSCEGPSRGGDGSGNGGVAGVGGSSAGTSGWAGAAGAGTAGAGGCGLSGVIGEISGSGVSSSCGGAGASGSGGAWGGGGASAISGSGGASAAGASGSGGAATTGGGAGSGGSATGHLVVSTPFVGFLSATCNGIANPPTTFTLSNGANAAINWSTTVTESLPFFSIAPTGSPLLPGETVTVTVTPLALLSGSLRHGFLPSFSGSIAISGDPAGTQTVSVTEPVTGIDISWTPTNLDFGMVPISTLPPVGNPSSSLTVTESAPTTTSPIELSSDNPSFSASLINSFSRTSWSVQFAPTKPGIQTATLTWGTQTSSSIFCSAHTFTATGTGIISGSAGCVAAAAPIGTPCGANQVCSVGACVRELTLIGSSVTASAGSFSGEVASGTVPWPSAPLTARIDWGDQTVSVGSIVFNPPVAPSVPFLVNGSHTYASPGSFQGTVTVTDKTTNFSAQTTFTASN